MADPPPTPPPPWGPPSPQTPWGSTTPAPGGPGAWGPGATTGLPHPAPVPTGRGRRIAFLVLATVLVLGVTAIGIAVIMDPDLLSTKDDGKASSAQSTTTAVPTLEQLTTRLVPACMGAPVPGAATRPLDGSSRTPLIVKLPTEFDSGPSAIDPPRLDAGFDTVACVSTTVVEPGRLCRLGPDGAIQADGSYVMGPFYTTFATTVEVVVRDASTAIEVGRFTREFARPECGFEVADGQFEYATDWNVINGDLLPLLLK